MSEESPEAIGEEETTLAPPPAPRSLWREVALGLVILLCGGIIGSCLTILLGPKAITARAFRPEPQVEQIAPRMVRDLKLSREQWETIRPLIVENMREAMAIRNDARAEAAEKLRKMEEAVAAELTPEQLARWKKIVAGYKMGVRQGGPRGPGGPEGSREGRGGGGMRRGQPGQSGQQWRGKAGNGRDEKARQPQPQGQ